MMFKKQLAFYVSDIDKFFHDFDQNRPFSTTRIEEKQKSEKIAHLRDSGGSVVDLPPVDGKNEE